MGAHTQPHGLSHALRDVRVCVGAEALVQPALAQVRLLAANGLVLVAAQTRKRPGSPGRSPEALDWRSPDQSW